jgi:hypothetical protein
LPRYLARAAEVGDSVALIPLDQPVAKGERRRRVRDGAVRGVNAAGHRGPRLRWRPQSGNLIERRGAALALPILLAVALNVAALAGLAGIAGFHAVYASLIRIQWPWLCAVPVALAISSIAWLSLGLPGVALDVTLPWAVIPVPAFAAAFWLAPRYRARLQGRAGWRARLSVFLDAVLLIRALFARPFRHRGAIAGMALFWVGDALAVWSALAAFGFVMNGAALIVGYCTGMVFTRRIAPLAGAGTLALILPLTIWASGAPLATAIAAIAAYRLLGGLSLPPALASLPVLRETSAGPRPCPASATDQRSGSDREDCDAADTPAPPTRTRQRRRPGRWDRRSRLLREQQDAGGQECADLDQFEHDVDVVRGRARRVLAGQHSIRSARQPGTHRAELENQDRDRYRADREHPRGQVSEDARDQQDRGEDRFRDVEGAVHEAADAQPDRHGNPGGPELQRRLEEGNAGNHPEPDEHHRDGGGRANTHDVEFTLLELYKLKRREGHPDGR